MTQQQSRQVQPLGPVCATSSGQASVAVRGRSSNQQSSRPFARLPLSLVWGVEKGCAGEGIGQRSA
eukprot:7558789-Prorocentrum_lima.AAC.1